MRPNPVLDIYASSALCRSAQHVDPRTVRLPVISGRDTRFTRLSTTEGLSQIKVSEIVQDDQGFMWFGTQYGLNRFDGYNFKVFVHDPRDANSLSGVLIGALFKDRDGTLWVGCDQFVNRFDRETETFRQYPVPSVYHISQDASGILWLATPNGLYSLDPSTGRIRRYSHDANDPSSSATTKSSRVLRIERAGSGSRMATGWMGLTAQPGR